MFGEHVLKALKDNENGIAFKFLERLHEALHVDGAKLMERNEPRATLKAARHGYARPLVVIRATMTVRR